MEVKIINKLFAFLSCLFCSVFLTVSCVKADSQSTGIDFTVTPDHSSTPNVDQNRTNNSWINVLPSTNQVVGLKINNRSDQDHKFQITLNTAYTGTDGGIHYDQISPPLDKSLLFDFRSMVRDNDKIVDIPSKTTQTFNISLQIPDISIYKGQVLGAVVVYEMSKPDVKIKGNTNIVNQFAMGFPVALNFGGSEIGVNSISDPFEIGTVQPGIGVRGGIAILSEIRNTKPEQLLDFSLKTEIRKQGSSTILYSANNKDVQMAPNSIYNQQTYWTNKNGIQAGRYLATFRIKMPGDNGKSYLFKRNFTITSSQADKLNRHIGIKPNYLWFYISIGSLIILFLLLLMFMLGRHWRHKK